MAANNADEQNSRYNALLTRAYQRGGAPSPNWIYAVITTRIFCRPSCPARLARRANILFYDRPEEAVLAGFRPCLRCRPEAPGPYCRPRDTAAERAKSSMSNMIAASVRLPQLQQQQQQQQQHGRIVKVGDIAVSLGLTKSHFCRAFKAAEGVGPGEWAKKEEQRQRAEAKVDISNSGGRMEVKNGCGAAGLSPTKLTPEGLQENHEFSTPVIDFLDWNRFIDFDALDEEDQCFGTSEASCLDP